RMHDEDSAEHIPGRRQRTARPRASASRTSRQRFAAMDEGRASVMRVSVFGLGYVGCVTAACLAKAGHQVIGVDINPDKVAMLGAGRSPIVEPGLGELLTEVVGRGRLSATTVSHEAVAQSDLAVICVGPPGPANGQ